MLKKSSKKISIYYNTLYVTKCQEKLEKILTFLKNCNKIIKRKNRYEVESFSPVAENTYTIYSKMRRYHDEQYYL